MPSQTNWITLRAPERVPRTRRLIRRISKDRNIWINKRPTWNCPAFFFTIVTVMLFASMWGEWFVCIFLWSLPPATHHINWCCCMHARQIPSKSGRLIKLASNTVPNSDAVSRARTGLCVPAGERDDCPGSRRHLHLCGEQSGWL